MKVCSSKYLHQYLCFMLQQKASLQQQLIYAALEKNLNNFAESLILGYCLWVVGFMGPWG